ncbi:MAG: glucoamylase [Proteobacteria bacterium]|nr:MAG: glucoamylase [Pseudomonadota bacterium]
MTVISNTVTPMKTIGGFGFLWALGCVVAGTASASSFNNSSDLQTWVTQQRPVAVDRLFQAISPADGAPGAVMASPSRSHPDYYYHWIRDAALVMKEVYRVKGERPNQSMSTLLDYARFSRRNQLMPNPSGTASDYGLGEPKFMINGDAYMPGWGRPQNDGPAIRAMVLTRLAFDLLNQGKGDVVSQILYRGEIPASTVIKADLEYVAHHWQDSNFDLWEEIYGDHFYTRIVQYRGLIEGARLARFLNDSGAADFYERQAGLIHDSLNAFWNPSKGYFDATIRRRGGAAHKSSQLDVAVILGVLHAEFDTGAFSIEDSRVLATALRLEEAFRALYPINHFPADVAPAIGRYPEDTYDGYGTDGRGNPWFLATHALAEFYYKLAVKTADQATTITVTKENRKVVQSSTGGNYLVGATLSTTDRLKLAQSFFAKAESFLARSKYHTPVGGSQDEQINRDTGAPQGARDLTWSYASFISLYEARETALKKLPASVLAITSDSAE